MQEMMGQTEWIAFKGLWLPIGFKVLISIICGGIIGLERELKHKPAGLRTNILICVGATLYSALSILISNHLNPAGMGGDPARLVAQVVSGIGFLGGGMIIKSGNSVTGLTSAATVWVVAAIGICIGAGYPIVGLIFTATVFFTLYFLSKVDNKLLGKLHCYECSIFTKGLDAGARASVMEVFEHGDLDMARLTVSEQEGQYLIFARYFSSEGRHLRMQAALWSIAEVDRVDVKVA